MAAETDFHLSGAVGEVSVVGDARETRVSLRGDWDLSGAPRLREELDCVDAAHHVVFDLSHMTYLDSSAMRVLVEFKLRSNSQNGSTAIFYGDNERARRLLSIGGVGTLF